MPFLDAGRRKWIVEGIRGCTSRTQLAQWRDALVHLQSQSGVDLELAIRQYDDASRQVESIYALRA